MVDMSSGNSNNAPSNNYGDIRVTSNQIAQVRNKYSHWETADRYLASKQQTILAEAKIRDLEAQLGRCDDSRQDLLRQLQNQEIAVRQAQEQVFAVVASNGPRAEDDEVIRSRLKSVTSQWKPFAKRWALKSFKELQGRNLEIAKPMIDELVANNEAHSPDGLFEPQNDSKAAGLLLNAELARFIINRLLERPFIAAFQADTPENSTGLKVATDQALHQTYLYIRSNTGMTSRARYDYH
jgi:hypothetical protein